jgi:uracil-DNA glycosylase
MTLQRTHILAEKIAAAQAWWQDAGVDLHFSDEPQSWLKPAELAPTAPPIPDNNAAPASAPPPAGAPTLPSIAPDTAGWPKTVEEFSNWWLAEPSLDESASAPRSVPRGPAGAELMVLVPAPEAGDNGRLLSGPQGKLLTAMLGAMNIAESETYFASVLPRNIAMPDWTELAAHGLREVTLHHIELVAPRRLLVLGCNILPLLDHNWTENSSSLPEINHRSGSLDVLGAWDLETLLTRAKARATFWQRWLDWTEGN